MVPKSIVSTQLLLPSKEPVEVLELCSGTQYAKELITLGLVWQSFHETLQLCKGSYLALSLVTEVF